MADDDTTRVADEPPADYFRPLKKQATCNCGAKPGRPVAECAECAPAPSVEEPEGERAKWDAERTEIAAERDELRAEVERQQSLIRSFRLGVSRLKFQRNSWRDAMRLVAHAIKCDVIEPDGPDDIGKKILIRYAVVGTESDPDEAPTPPAETGEAVHHKWRVVWYESDFDDPDDRSGYMLSVENGLGLTDVEAESAADWLNRRAAIEFQLAELKSDNNRLNSMLRRTGYGQGQIDAHMDIEEENEKLLAQLATYKQQAEAWDFVERMEPEIFKERGFEPEARCWFGGVGYSASGPTKLEAVLALAALLESQQPSDGKAPESQLQGGK